MPTLALLCTMFELVTGDASSDVGRLLVPLIAGMSVVLVVGGFMMPRGSVSVLRISRAAASGFFVIRVRAILSFLLLRHTHSRAHCSLTPV
uniref:Putative secreted peptide n=1 Tax=Anopheles braziliensis TaxID=58242 RepID=A0A2M3ZU36_9DIPT